MGVRTAYAYLSDCVFSGDFSESLQIGDDGYEPL